MDSLLSSHYNCVTSKSRGVQIAPEVASILGKEADVVWGGFAPGVAHLLLNASHVAFQSCDVLLGPLPVNPLQLQEGGRFCSHVWDGALQGKAQEFDPNVRQSIGTI